MSRSFPTRRPSDLCTTKGLARFVADLNLGGPAAQSGKDEFLRVLISFGEALAAGVGGVGVHRPVDELRADRCQHFGTAEQQVISEMAAQRDRKSTRLNSSH